MGGEEEDKNLTPQRHRDTEKTLGKNDVIKVVPSSSSSEPATEVTESTEVCDEKLVAVRDDSSR
jgi:hypothetical protein